MDGRDGVTCYFRGCGNIRRGGGGQVMCSCSCTKYMRSTLVFYSPINMYIFCVHNNGTWYVHTYLKMNTSFKSDLGIAKFND